jgi:C4-dicarboxylate transporter DctQ subunit
MINRLEEWVMAALLAFMTLLTFAQVVMRYVFNTGWVWSLEATTYSFAALVLVGMSYGVRTHTHIAIDLFVKRFPPRLRRLIALAVVVVCLVYAVLMLYGSSELVARLMTLGNAARDISAPKWLLTMTMPIGFVLLAFRFLQAGWQLLRHPDSAGAVGQSHLPNVAMNKEDSEGQS